MSLFSFDNRLHMATLYKYILPGIGPAGWGGTERRRKTRMS